ncbi:thiazole biosynthesis adenylyltransferase ThiF [Vibrio zhanjiangensis]|uniref:Thiazole biosynthesis adenylyltransferase ThiF n=1 Tax=Vibrio zhanjiangensis TaxID=1046128 RepID=A0ABQ6F0R3_9VIBR|nr:HesA/MoeB/ThiF family protein [Vibrio zhanjiangensis]GLT19073.1 thiazole biosynthesis adenylyltransferase ThiF [Vibrio zhanjiangensis]
MLTDKEFIRYQRQISLPEIGEHGQSNLARSHVLMIGCGGLGSAASLYMAAAGIGKLVIVDDDEVDASNLQRQVVYREQDISDGKTQAMAKQLRSLNPLVKVRCLNKRLSRVQLKLEVSLADVVLDCSDNMPTRQLINQVCYEQKIDLISAAAIGWQGQFCVFDYRSMLASQPCYRCLYPFDDVTQPRSCAETGVVGPVVGILGNYQALAVIQRLATGKFYMDTAQLHRFDGLSMTWQRMVVKKDLKCKVCSSA